MQKYKLHLLILRNDPSLKPAELRAEVCSDLDDGAPVTLPGEGIGLVVDLLQGLLGRAVVL